MICAPPRSIERTSLLHGTAYVVPRSNTGCQAMGVQRSDVGVQETEADMLPNPSWWQKAACVAIILALQAVMILADAWPILAH